MRLRVVLLACVASVLPVSGFGQGYTFRPGPRGFDPRMNRYGETETRPTTTAATDRFDPSHTTVRVELLMEAENGGLEAQQWSKTLADFGYPARIRRPVLDDKPGISESSRGPLRTVTVVGTLDGRGGLAFPGRRFARDEAASLKEWLDELKKYGAQGSPEGKPLWGLSKSQFEAVYAALARPVTTDTTGLTLDEALAKLPLPKEYALRFNAAAKSEADLAQGTRVSRSVAGLTAGTGLAFVFNEFGLGFRPERTPEGGIDLLVEPLPAPTKPTAEDDEKPLVYWPVGWDVKEDTAPASKKPVRDEDAVLPNRLQLAPSLFAVREIGFDKAPLAEVFAAAEEATGMPVLLDRAGVEAAGVNLAKARFSQPAKRTMWMIALGSATFPNRLRHDLRRDEAGHPLVWVSPSRVGR